jgi:hypothetical protein
MPKRNRAPAPFAGTPATRHTAGTPRRPVRGGAPEPGGASRARTGEDGRVTRTRPILAHDTRRFGGRHGAPNPRRMPPDLGDPRVGQASVFSVSLLIAINSLSEGITGR